MFRSKNVPLDVKNLNKAIIKKKKKLKKLLGKEIMQGKNKGFPSFTSFGSSTSLEAPASELPF